MPSSRALVRALIVRLLWNRSLSDVERAKTILAPLSGLNGSWVVMVEKCTPAQLITVMKNNVALLNHSRSRG